MTCKKSGWLSLGCCLWLGLSLGLAFFLDRVGVNVTSMIMIMVIVVVMIMVVVVPMMIMVVVVPMMIMAVVVVTMFLGMRQPFFFSKFLKADRAIRYLGHLQDEIDHLFFVQRSAQGITGLLRLA